MDNYEEFLSVVRLYEYNNEKKHLEEELKKEEENFHNISQIKDEIQSVLTQLDKDISISKNTK